MAATQADTAPAGPLSLTLSQWWCVLKGVHATAERANLALISAGVAFFGLMAAIPGIAALVALVGLFADPVVISDQIGALYGVAPDDVVRTISGEVARILAAQQGTLLLGFLLNLALSLWGALQGVRWVLIALTTVNRRSEKRKSLRRTIAAARFTLSGVGLAVLAVLLMGVLPLVLAALRLERGTEMLLLVLRWPVLGGAGLAYCLMLYRWGPRRRPPPWRWLWPGAIAAPLLWLAASTVLTLVMRLFPSFGAAYGSLASAVALLTWFYWTALVFLLGGALNAELEFFAHGRPAAPVSSEEKIESPIAADGGQKQVRA